MKLSISNIAWKSEDDFKVYKLMKKYEYKGLEIAPTRIFSEQPYKKLTEAKIWYEELNKKYGFTISSMQSIWFGRQENIFNSVDERKILEKYTKQAIDFAATIGCKNLVFGCPKNRNLIEGSNEEIAVDFFKLLGNYAYEKGTTIGMEANPTIYNTNYINDTKSALELIKKVDSNFVSNYNFSDEHNVMTWYNSHCVRYNSVGAQNSKTLRYFYEYASNF